MNHGLSDLALTTRLPQDTPTMPLRTGWEEDSRPPDSTIATYRRVSPSFGVHSGE